MKNFCTNLFRKLCIYRKVVINKSEVLSPNIQNGNTSDKTVDKSGDDLNENILKNNDDNKRLLNDSNNSGNGPDKNNDDNKRPQHDSNENVNKDKCYYINIKAIIDYVNDHFNDNKCVARGDDDDIIITDADYAKVNKECIVNIQDCNPKYFLPADVVNKVLSPDEFSDDITVPSESSPITESPDFSSNTEYSGNSEINESLEISIDDRSMVSHENFIQQFLLNPKNYKFYDRDVFLILYENRTFVETLLTSPQYYSCFCVFMRHVNMFRLEFRENYPNSISIALNHDNFKVMCYMIYHTVDVVPNTILYTEHQQTKERNFLVLCVEKIIFEHGDICKMDKILESIDNYSGFAFINNGSFANMDNDLIGYLLRAFECNDLPLLLDHIIKCLVILFRNNPKLFNFRYQYSTKPTVDVVEYIIFMQNPYLIHLLRNLVPLANFSPRRIERYRMIAERRWPFGDIHDRINQILSPI